MSSPNPSWLQGLDLYIPSIFMELLVHVRSSWVLGVQQPALQTSSA